MMRGSDDESNNAVPKISKGDSAREKGVVRGASSFLQGEKFPDGKAC